MASQYASLGPDQADAAGEEDDRGHDRRLQQAAIRDPRPGAPPAREKVSLLSMLQASAPAYTCASQKTIIVTSTIPSERQIVADASAAATIDVTRIVP